jgi:hypothetical protein
MSETKNDKPQAKPVPAYMVGPGGAQPIPVKLLRCRTGITMELPGRDGAAKVMCADDSKAGQINIPRRKIYLLPWLGSYCIMYYNAGETEPTGEPLMVPREWCQWVPM